MVVDQGHHWIVWDGTCGFCRRAVEWALRHDASAHLRAVPYQDVPSPPMTEALREACRRAVHVRTTDGRWLRGGRACLFVLEHIGWPRLARIAALPPLVWLVEGGYALVAHNRAFFSRLLPRPRNV
jgi:predicted DCC family thiol-disulfide oxidoreductase YuxK